MARKTTAAETRAILQKIASTAKVGPVSRLQAIRADICKRYRQREKVVEMMLASMLAGELMLLLGPRGEAKTAIVEALAGYIEGGRHFSVGLAKSSTPDDILGGVDVVALQQGTYQRNVDGFLPTATTFLLDEGFKSNNPTLQALLRVLSEREYQGQRIPALFGAIASNELPPELRGQKNGKTQDLGPFEDSLLAFFDRFFHKAYVSPLDAGTADWDDVVFGDTADAQAPVRITVEQVRALQAQVNGVTIPDGVRSAIRKLADALLQAKHPVHVSTRTWRKAMRVLKAHALLDGRTQVSRGDLVWLQYAFWTTPDQQHVIREMVTQLGSPELMEAMAVENRIAELEVAYSSRRLAVDTRDGLVVSEAPVSQLASAAVVETYLLWLRRQEVELRGLVDKADEGDQAEILRVASWAAECKARVQESMMQRLRQL